MTPAISNPSPKAVAVINVVVGYSQLIFIEPAEFLEKFLLRQHASSRDGRVITGNPQIGKVTGLIGIDSTKGRSGETPVHAVDDSGVLDLAIWKEQLGSHGAYALDSQHGAWYGTQSVAISTAAAAATGVSDRAER